MEKIIKIKIEINDLETKRVQGINGTKSWFFEKINWQTFSQANQKKKGKDPNQQSQR
jgi:hypothetical protein